MKDFLLAQLTRYKSLLIYFCASASAACLDLLLVYVLKSVITTSIVWINTISVTSTAVFHYIFTSKKAFHASIGIYSAVIYLITFILGLILQDWVIWTCFEIVKLPLWASKGISLMASFFILYFLRKFLYAMASKSGNGKEKGRRIKK